MAGQNGSDRLDRIERAVELFVKDHELFRQEHKQLLAVQVVLADRLDKPTVRVDKLAEMGQHTDERLNTLITVVDGLLRKQQ